MFNSAIKILIISLLCCSAVHAQQKQIVVRGKFLSDSIKLGKPVDYCLAVSYPSITNVLFPDTTFNFSPFEIHKKKIFPTQSKDGISYDSAVYSLTSYEIDSIQTLALPIFAVAQKDCVIYYAQRDSIIFHKVVSAVPDSVAIAGLPLKTDTAYRKVNTELNYLIIGIAGGVFILASIIIWILFGKRIRVYFVSRRLDKKHQAFLSQFNKEMDRLAQVPSATQAEITLKIWKSYLESLLVKPYTKYTSKEIREKESNDSLWQNLKAIDRMIYAGQIDLADNPFPSLKEFSQLKYEQKLEEVRNG